MTLKELINEITKLNKEIENLREQIRLCENEKVKKDFG